MSAASEHLAPAPGFRKLDRAQMAARLARDIPEGWVVNLGIGIPTQVADHVPLTREVIFQSENGCSAWAPRPRPTRSIPG